MRVLARIVPGLRNRYRRLVGDVLDRVTGRPPAPAQVAPEHRVIFVCYGNSCRSPLAEGLLRAKLAHEGLLGRVLVEGAGTDAGDPAAPPDWRARRAARRRGIAIGDLRSRRFVRDDFDRFDRVLVFDRRNRDAVLALARDERDREKVDFVLGGDEEVADPVNGSQTDFARTLVVLDRATDALLEDVRLRLGRPR